VTWGLRRMAQIWHKRRAQKNSPGGLFGLPGLLRRETTLFEAAKWWAVQDLNL
jgi:hypothetical protein